MLNTLEVGSSFVFDLKFIYPAKFKCQNGAATINVANEVKSKDLNIDLTLNCNFVYDLNKKTSFLIVKQSQYDLNISLLN